MLPSAARCRTSGPGRLSRPSCSIHPHFRGIFKGPQLRGNQYSHPRTYTTTTPIQERKGTFWNSTHLYYNKSAMPSHTFKRKADSGIEQPKRMKQDEQVTERLFPSAPNGSGPHVNGVNGFSLDSTETIDEERFFPIAVVGIGCRMPGNVNCPEDFKKVMEDGIDVISEIPADRWDMDKYWHPDPHNVGTHCNRRAGFCENVHDFDHTFYNVSPREAANMDVMHRGLLEVTQECLDDAGIPGESMPRDTGVYIGVCLMDHGFTVIEDAKCMNAYTHTGTAHSVAANRISYAYDIRGPSVAIDTACAASLTSMHYACFALWNKECPEAIVGASNTLMVPEVTVGFSALGVLSPDGVSCPFSARAKGYVRSEGTGVLYIKPLKDALANGDHIYCTIRASWLAHNGYSLSITMPSTEAQAEMMKKTYDVFGLDINKTDFVEAHGTGTPVGDPLEAEGIAQAFTIDNKKRQDPMPVGSSKSNFGHMEGAAGMVQVIKTALMLENRVIYPNINYGEPNPAIDLEGWNVRVPTENEEFKKDKLFRIGVNTFGFGGALAHMVFEEARQKLPQQKNKGSAGWKVGKSAEKGLKIPFVLSAKSSAALRGYCQKWIDFESDDDAMEVACWLATRRSHYSNRIVIFADSGADLREKLQMYVDKQAHEEIVESTLPPHSEEKKICFIFPGQGQQSFDMGRTLYKDEPVFRRAVDECDKYYKKLSGKSFMHTYNLFVPLDSTKKYNPDIVNEIQVSQPAILFLQVGLYHLMLHWGITPDALVGHSLGEVAAAYASGAVTLEEAVTVQYYRAEQQVKLDGTGSMAAFRVSAEEGEKLCQNYKDLYVACNNAHESITIAGSKPVIKEICADNPGNAKELRVKCAFHTPHMDPLKDEFMKAVEGKLRNGRPTKSAWYSTVTGHLYDGEATAQYFWDNIRGRVQFLDAVRGVMEDFQNVLFLEIAGAATLLSSIRSIAKGENYTPSGMVPCGQRQKDDRVSTLRALATLHGLAIKIDWGNVLDNCEKWMRLPLYAWQHSTFRYEAEGMRQRRLDLEDRTYRGLNGVVRLEQLPFLRDHVINGKLGFPRSGYLEYILQTQFKEDDIPALSNVKFHPDTLELSEDVDLNGEVPERKVLRTKSVKIQNGQRIEVESDGKVFCQADKYNQDKRYQQVFDIEKLMKQCPVKISSDDYYAKFADLGLEYTDSMRFKAVKHFYLGDGEAFAELHQARDKRERINTIILDAAFTVVMAAQQKSSTLLTPISIDQIQMKVGQIPRKVPLFVYTRLSLADAVNLVGDIYIMDEQGKVVVEIKQFTAKNISGSVTPKLDLTQCLYTTEWQPIDACLPPTTMLQEFFSEENLRERYPEDMDAITIAEKYSSLTKEICAAYAKHAVNSVQVKDVNPKVERYATRLRQMAETIPTNLKYEDIKKRIELIERACPEYHQEMLMIERMGNILPEALKDPRYALSELFTEDMMGAYFIDSLTVNIYYKAIADVVRKAVERSLQSKKIVRVLEIGGRLGGLSQYICAALEDLLTEGKVEYVFTDINVAFFHLVQEKLKDFKNVRFQQLDIEKDIKTQNFVANSMDLVVCLDTLHCTENAVEATSNMRDLLCKDGWSILMESTNNHNTPEIIFGAFDLCWIFEDERQDRCWMSQSGWSGVMRKAGFSDVVAVSTPNEFYHSLIVGRKTNMSLNYPKYHMEDETAESEMAVDCEEPKMFFVCAPDDVLAQYVCKKMDDNGSVITPNHLENELKAKMPFNGPVVVVYFSETDAEVHDTVNVLKPCILIENRNSSLWIVNRDTESTSLDQSATAAFVRTAISEMKDIDVYMVHLDQSGLYNQTRELCALLQNHTHTDREVAIQNGQVLVPRMIRQSLTKKLDCNGSEWQVAALSAEEDILDEVDFHASRSRNPGPGEVRIIVQATAINEKDMSAINNAMRPRSVKVGSECAGIVASTGPGVANVKTCDKVIAFGDNCLASSIIVSADKVFKKPTLLSAAESAGSGIAYANAVFALLTRAGLKKGQTVLIHSACTGVGQACIEVAKLIGANIICTESSEDKLAYLKGQCHIHNVSHAEPVTFYNDVMNWTSRRGVDVVINFEGGRILEQSISCLSHGGHLCQMGGMDMFESSQFVLSALVKNVSVHAIQIEELMQKEPSAFCQLMLEVLKQMEDGALHPIPTSVCSISDAMETVKNAASLDIIGRLVAEVPSCYSPELQPPTEIFKPDATYVVTGSSGGIGQEVSRWMVRNGAKHIALVSKQGHRSWFQTATIRHLEKQGATVYEVRADLSKENTLKETFRRMTANGKPSVKGIFHLAGLNEDEPIETVDSKQVEESLNTRGRSAQWLHEVTKELGIQLDHFVLFSSSKAAWGNPNLAAFNSSCEILDALATQRREEGLPALSVQAGWLRGAGWLEDKSRAASLEPFTKGTSLHVREFLSLLRKVLLRTDLPPVVMLANEDWDSVSELTYTDSLLFRHYASSSGKRRGGSDMSKDDLQRKVVEKLGGLLMMSADDIDVAQPMIHYGVDSLISLDITNWMRKEFNLQVNQMDILEGMTTASLIEQALG